MTLVYPALKTPGAAIPISMGAGAPASGTDSDGVGGFLSTAFHDLIDVVNPLQHLPVVGTLYRAITGEHIGTVEKIAGDALYGGLWGAVSSVADAAFEAVTGKDFGATVLAMLTGKDDTPSVAVAAAAPGPAAIPAAASLSTQDTIGLGAFSQALRDKGVSAGMAVRAMDAYRKANGMVLAAAN